MEMWQTLSEEVNPSAEWNRNDRGIKRITAQKELKRVREDREQTALPSSPSSPPLTCSNNCNSTHHVLQSLIHIHIQLYIYIYNCVYTCDTCMYIIYAYLRSSDGGEASLDM